MKSAVSENLKSTSLDWTVTYDNFAPEFAANLSPVYFIQMFNVTANIGNATCHYFNITGTKAASSTTAPVTSMPTAGSPTAFITVTATGFPAATNTLNSSSTQVQTGQGTGISAGTIAGIGIGVSLATMMVVGLLGWSVWRQKERSRGARTEQEGVRERADTTIHNERPPRDTRGRGRGRGRRRWQWAQELPDEGSQRPKPEDAERGTQRHEVSGQSRRRNELEGSYPPHRWYELSESYR